MNQKIILSPRENEILTEMSKGMKCKDIAKKLQISESTVRKHRRQIIRKNGKPNAIASITFSQDFSFKNIPELSSRENEITQLIFSGKSSKNIAKDLSISYFTVLKHRENILKKMNCNNFLSLARKIISSYSSPKCIRNRDHRQSPLNSNTQLANNADRGDKK